MTIKCYDFFGCTKPGCIMIKDGVEKNCWDIEPELTPCTDMFGDSIKMEDKIVFCQNCLFYEHVNKATT